MSATRLRVVSNGRAGGTHVYTEDDQEVAGISSITWTVDTAGNWVAKADIRVELFSLDIQGEVDNAHIQVTIPPWLREDDLVNVTFTPRIG